MPRPLGKLVSVAADDDWTVNSVAPVPDPDVWLCALNLILLGNTVRTATDISGNGRSHVQPTEALRPTYDAGPPELMVFDDSATAQYLAGPTQSFLANRPFAILILAELTGTTPDLLYGALNPGAGIRVLDDSAEYNGVSVNFARNTSLAVRTAWHDGSIYHYRHGGAEQASAAIPLAALPFNVMGLGGVSVASGMRVRSVLVYAKTLTLSQIQTAEEWLLAECGV